jgi:triosephosphate isomerase
MRKFLVAGNWKMNGNKVEITTLLQQLLIKMNDLNHQIDCVVCPPSIYIDYVHQLIKNSNIQIGAQNLASNSVTAFTGEISPVMLREFGCNYVIIGHSERRLLLQESDELIARKFQIAIEADIKPILCVGETKEQQADGLNVVEKQLIAVIDKVGIAAFEQAVIAYEPVWAIGTGLTATPEQAQTMHAHIRHILAQRDAKVAAKVQIIYGGSVNSSNAAGLFTQVDIDGGLIGGASLKAQDFSDICHIAMGMAKQ